MPPTPYRSFNSTNSVCKIPLLKRKKGAKRCEWRYVCTGGCPLLTYRATGRYDLKSPNCHIYKTLFPELLRARKFTPAPIPFATYRLIHSLQVAGLQVCRFAGLQVCRWQVCRLQVCRLQVCRLQVCRLQVRRYLLGATCHLPLLAPCIHPSTLSQTIP